MSRLVLLVEVGPSLGKYVAICHISRGGSTQSSRNTTGYDIADMLLYVRPVKKSNYQFGIAIKEAGFCEV